MQSYSSEVYLPCEIPEISYLSRRKIFLDFQYEQEISLKPMSVIPFFTGALIFIDTAAFFINDFELLLSIDGEEKTLSKHLIDHPERKKELEELNAVGGIRFIPSKNNLHFSSEAYAYKKYYEGKEWTNFSLSPLLLEIDITNNCNALCIHCSRDAKKSTINMSLKTIREKLSQCQKYNIPEILLMGGEPLLHPDFKDILKIAKDYGIPSIRTSTNGILITSEIADLLAMHSVGVQVSIHGASLDTHESVTKCKGSFKKACDAVKLLRSKGIDVDISFTILELNEKDIYEMPKLALELGANGLRYLALSNVGRGKQLETLTNSKRDELGAKIREIYEIYQPQGLEIAVGGFPALTPIKMNATLYGCAAGRTILHLDCSNRFNPCGSVEGYYISNMSQTGCKIDINGKINQIVDEEIYYNNILEIWHDDKLKKIRSASKCKCSYRLICSGACKADTDFLD